jgi:small subunit ribosomal protein S9
MAKKLIKKASRPQKIIKRPAQVVGSRPQPSKSDVPGEARVFNVAAVEYVEGIGRRKVATARVRIYQHEGGDMVVNQQLASEYFSGVPHAAALYTKPFELTGTKGKFAMTVKVTGSGISAQLDAVVHGLSRALIKFDPTFKPLLKLQGLLTRDDRQKETRKPGRGGKARRKRQSPKR